MILENFKYSNTIKKWFSQLFRW